MSGAQPYSFLRHLCVSIWLNHDPAECWVAVFTGYYDASGAQADPSGAILIVGSVSTEKKWLRLETQWRTALKSYGVPYLHMKELRASQGAFKGWHQDKQQELLAELVPIIKRGVNKSFAHTVFLADFRLVNSLYRFTDEFGGPYSFCAGVCVRKIKNWVAKRYPGKRLVHVFEKGDTGQGEFKKFVRKLEHVEPHMKEKVDCVTGEWFVPFQVADFLAWECRRAIVDVRSGKRTIRGSLSEIIKELPLAAHYQDAGMLARFCEYRKIERRRAL